MNILKRYIAHPLKLALFKYLPSEMRNIFPRVDQLERIIYRDNHDDRERQNVLFFGRILKDDGSLRSTAKLSEHTKIGTEVYFHHREKAEIALTVGSSWYGGDYFEFGSHGLSTFRNMLSAYDICTMTKQYQDVRFYGFDVFGDPAVNAPEKEGQILPKNFVTFFPI